MVGRLIALLIVLALAASVVWALDAEQGRVALESTRLTDLELEDPLVVDGVTLNVVDLGGGPIPVVFIHDLDPAGSVIFQDVMAHLPDRFGGMAVDLPGFGLSQRLTEPGSHYTVAALSETLSDVLTERVPIKAILVGVGMGGEVAAELAVSHPDQARGLVLVDVDFWESESWLDAASGIPFFGGPLTFTFEAGGRMGLRTWAPNCETWASGPDSGGWCPTATQEEARLLATGVAGTTASIRAFKATKPSSLVPADLPSITLPTVYVWSNRGDVPAETVDRIKSLIEALHVLEVDAWQSHVESPASIGEALEIVSP